MPVDGAIEEGNIDLRYRPRVTNADGSISTVRSIGVNVNGQEVLIPTVSDDGRILTNQEAIAEYKRTGRHLGKFSSVAASNAAGQRIHLEQERMMSESEIGVYGPPPPPLEGPPSPFGDFGVAPNPSPYLGPPAMAAPMQPPQQAQPTWTLDPRDSHAILARALQIDPEAGLPPHRPPEAKLQVTMNNIVGSIGRLFHNEALINDAEQHRKAWEHIDEQQRTMRLEAAVGQAQGEARAIEDAKATREREQQLNFSALKFYYDNMPSAWEVYNPQNSKWEIADPKYAIPRAKAMLLGTPDVNDGQVMRFNPEAAQRRKEDAALDKQAAQGKIVSDREQANWKERFRMQSAREDAALELEGVKQMGGGKGSATNLPSTVKNLDANLEMLLKRARPKPTREDLTSNEALAAFNERSDAPSAMMAAPKMRSELVRSMSDLANHAANDVAALNPEYAQKVLTRFAVVAGIPGKDRGEAVTAMQREFERLYSIAQKADLKYKGRSQFAANLKQALSEYESRIREALAAREQAPPILAPRNPPSSVPAAANQAPGGMATSDFDEGEAAIGGNLQ